MSTSAWTLTLALVLLASGCRKEGTTGSQPQATGVPSASNSGASVASAAPPPERTAPRRAINHLQVLGLESEGRPTLAILGAKWCQWCRILDSDVLSQADVQARMKRDFDVTHVDVDVTPTWLDLPGVGGLPSLVFFDNAGRHVWTESGFRSRPEVLDLLSSVVQKLATNSLQAYPEFNPAPVLPDAPLSKQQARSALLSFEKQIFLKINSHDGGFHTPARHPYPDLLRELAEWAKLGAPPRVKRWVELTMDSALRGGSPRLSGEPQPDMTLGAAELMRFSQLGKGPSYRERVEQLPGMDPYLGLQDPVDRGVFRYAAGPGWYHPHFERRASDNLAWVLAARAIERPARAREIEQFVLSTLVVHGRVASAQRADPFYFRLKREERKFTKSPALVEVYPMAVQARAARVLPQRCANLEAIDTKNWPRAVIDAKDSPPATPDDVGELLLALASCDQNFRHKASALAKLVTERWARNALPAMASPSRLHRMVAGLCAVRSPQCGRALAAVVQLPLSLQHAPPLVALANFIDR